MAVTVFRFLTDAVQILFLQLRAKVFHKCYGPRTILGKHYKSQISIESGPGTSSNQPDLTLSLPAIRRLYDHIEEARPKGFSVAYGPLYHEEDCEMWMKVKEEAWTHIFLNCGTHLDISIEDKALALYGDSIEWNLHTHSRETGRSASLSNDLGNFRRDSCLLLQMALLVLGGADQLRLPPEERLFGELPLNRVTLLRAALSSMFVVGNQIPLVVLQAAMKHEFFSDAVNRGIWEQPIELEQRVLFELLLVPALRNASGGGDRSIPTALLNDNSELVIRWHENVRKLEDGPFGISIWFKVLQTGFWLLQRLIILPFSVGQLLMTTVRKVPSPEKANDLLHGLWLLMTGLDADHAAKVDQDSKYRGKRDRIFDFILPTVPSATQLKELGIVFQYKEGITISDIRFKKIRFNASLVLPRIILDFDSDTEILLANLIKYEIAHFSERNWKVCEYLQLMRELIRTPEDAKIVAASGVIVVDPNQEARVPVLFEKLDIPRVRSHLGPLGRVRNELINYIRPSPFKILRDVLSVVVLLALIQTIFTVLPYFHKK